LDPCAVVVWFLFEDYFAVYIGFGLNCSSYDGAKFMHAPVISWNHCCTEGTEETGVVIGHYS